MKPQAPLTTPSGESELDPGDVLGRGVDQEVDVLCRSDGAVADHGETADEDVAGAASVQRGADASEVVERRRADVRAIIRVIHSSASSKLRKR